MKKAVVLDAFHGLGHHSPLACIASALLQTSDYEVYYLCSPAYVDAVTRHVATLVSPELATRFEKECVLRIDDPTRFEDVFAVVEAEGRMPLVEANEARSAYVEAALATVLRTRRAGDVVGVVDFMTLSAARAFKRAGVAYFVTHPLPTDDLAAFGCDGVPIPSFFVLFMYVVFRVVPSMRTMMGEFRAGVKEVVDSSRGVFASCLAPAVAFGCVPLRSSPRMHYVHTFSPATDAARLDGFLDAQPAARAFLASKKPLVVFGGSSIPAQSLTAFGLATMLGALRRARDEWNVILKIVHAPTFLDALQKCGVDDLEREADWLLALDWIPQANLLDRAAAFVSHMGWNSTCEALQRGVPMLACPIGVDQPMNAHHVTNLGVAVALETHDPAYPLHPGTVEAIEHRAPERITETEVLAKLRALVAPDSPYRAAARAVRSEHFAEGATDIGPAAVVAELDRHFAATG